MPDRYRRSRWDHYALGTIATVAVFAVRLALDSVNALPGAKFLLIVLPVVAASWTGGLWPGIFTTVLCLIGADLFFLQPHGALSLTPDAIIPLTLFLIQGIIISWMGQSRRLALAEMEQRVLDRTSDLMRTNEQLKHEVTQRLAAAERLQVLNDKLEISNRELQDFASVASHDLQEPLRKIQAFGDRLRTKVGESLGEEPADYLRRMQNAAERMQTLINDLLTFSRVSTRAQPFVRTDLNKILADVLNDLETRIEQKGATVEVELLPTIEADPMQMRQLLQNLISNGLKFARPDIPPTVRIGGGWDGERHVKIAVRDNGIGFDEKYLDRIFNVFQRLHGRGAYEGTGIGLAVCRRIVERHGGTITARSTPGEGATFEVTLPSRQDTKAEGGSTDAPRT